MNTLNNNHGIGFSKSRRVFTILAVAGVIGFLGMDKNTEITQGQPFVLVNETGEQDHVVRNALARRLDTVLNQYFARKDQVMTNGYRVHRVQSNHGNLTVQLGAFTGMGNNCLIVTGKNENKDVNFIYNAEGSFMSLSKEMSYGDLAEILGTLELSM